MRKSVWVKYAICTLLLVGLSCAYADPVDSLKSLSDSVIVSRLTLQEKNRVIKFVFHADTASTVCDTVSDFTEIERVYCHRRQQLWNGK